MNRFAYEFWCKIILERAGEFMRILIQNVNIDQKVLRDMQAFFLEMKYIFQSYGELKDAAEKCVMSLLCVQYEDIKLDVFRKNFMTDIAGFLDKLSKESRYLNDDELGFGVIVQNEGKYLPEWIEYHKLIGVSRFFIYDNESNDNTEEILEPYVADGTVTYINWPGKAQQKIVFDHIINCFQNEVRLMGFLDADEFLLPLAQKTAVEIIDEIMGEDSFAAGVAINWRIFGSSGFEKEPDGLVIRNYIKCSAPDFQQNQYLKIICDPRMVLCPISPHIFHYKNFFYSVNEDGEFQNQYYNKTGVNGCKKLQINHYYTKSKEFWGNKKMKGGDGFFLRNMRTWSQFQEFDRNEMEDRRIFRYVDAVETALKRRGF